MDKIKHDIAQVFMDLAQGLETGQFGKKTRVAVIGPGSELGEENVIQGCQLAARQGVEVLYLGNAQAEGVTTIPCDCADDAFETMEELLASGQADAAVAMHYPFPIGVSTVGRVVAPATGKNVYLATTTGTNSTDRVEAMVLNTIAGIATAKADGLANPSIGLLNLDGTRQVESILKQLQTGGYPVNFAASGRSDGGSVMRGNDLLTGAQDVLVTDSLTGNVLMKVLSAYSSGGSYETLGAGYGPGVGEKMSGIIMIISRASGAPVIGQAIEYAASLSQGKLEAAYKQELALAKKAGLDRLLQERKESAAGKAVEEIKAPPSEVVTEQIEGIDVLDLEDAVHLLWSKNIYAESGMGCTGPIVRVSTANLDQAAEILRQGGYVNE
ncbi:MAG TPA: glycine/sarcosine/betaine reductase complex component C subunit alpha [Clostridia bacterium]|nr:glycine/sarcosine/betaine reductase complex component C subunit alpha [Clostridia bacterium]